MREAISVEQLCRKLEEKAKKKERSWQPTRKEEEGDYWNIGKRDASSSPRVEIVQLGDSGSGRMSEGGRTGT